MEECPVFYLFCVISRDCSLSFVCILSALILLMDLLRVLTLWRRLMMMTKKTVTTPDKAIIMTISPWSYPFLSLVSLLSTLSSVTMFGKSLASWVIHEHVDRSNVKPVNIVFETYLMFSTQMMLWIISLWNLLQTAEHSFSWRPFYSFLVYLFSMAWASAWDTCRHTPHCPRPCPGPCTRCTPPPPCTDTCTPECWRCVWHCDRPSAPGDSHTCRHCPPLWPGWHRDVVWQPPPQRLASTNWGVIWK